MNVLPILALTTVAAGYFGAIGQTNAMFDAGDTGVTSYQARPGLSVDSLMERPAQSVDQPFCDLTATVTSTLSHDFAEMHQDTWVQGGDMTLQLWGSDVMGTWTLLHLGQDGIACVVSSGTGWSDGVIPESVLALANVANS